LDYDMIDVFWFNEKEIMSGSFAVHSVVEVKRG